MSSIRSFTAIPDNVSQNEEFALETFCRKSGSVVFEIKDSDSVKFHNGKSKLEIEVGRGSNSALCSISGATGIIKIFAYFIDESDDQKHYFVTLR